jgi:hypothetical protein
MQADLSVLFPAVCQFVEAAKIPSLLLTSLRSLAPCSSKTLLLFELLPLIVDTMLTGLFKFLILEERNGVSE